MVAQAGYVEVLRGRLDAGGRGTGNEPNRRLQFVASGRDEAGVRPEAPPWITFFVEAAKRGASPVEFGEDPAGTHSLFDGFGGDVGTQARPGADQDADRPGGIAV